jgi:hypothetical protein
MKIRRRLPTKGGWTKETSAKAHEAKARKRMESPPCNEPRRVPQGEYLGTLRWYSVDGTLKSWVITQGDRANNIQVQAKQKLVICGWDKFLVGLRKHLSISKRIFAHIDV